MSNREIDLTRRKILGALGAVGAAGAGAGLGTSALFNDTEAFENNSITAGTLDMTVTAEIVAANQYWEDEGIIESMETADGDPVAGLQATDIKPGDWAIICFTIDVLENPGCVTITTENLTDYENGQTEPESQVDSSAGGSLGGSLDGQGNGELQNELVAEVWENFDDEVDSESPRDYLTNRDPTTPAGTTIVDANNTYSTGVTVGGGTAFNNRQFYLLLELPSDVGNEVQSDAVQWDLKFEAIQARNNEDCGTVVQLPETSYIGYEDQLVDQPFSDFDYNDFGMFADITEIYSGGDLSKIEMTFEAEVREAGDDSDIHIKRTFGSGVTYDYTVTRPNHVSAGFETAAGTTNASGNLDITLFDTGEGDRVGNRVEITVENISGSVSQPSGSPRPDIAANNDLFAVYDPYLENRSTGTTIDIERVNDNVESGDLDGSGDGWDDQSDVPSIIVIPDAGFVPPAEGDPMPTKYAEFNDYYGDDSGDTDGDLDVNSGFDDWYLNPNP